MQEQSRMNKVSRQNQSSNHSSEFKSFLQWQNELAEEQGQPIDRVELFKETHDLSDQFVSQAAVDAHASLWCNFVLFCTYTYAFIT